MLRQQESFVPYSAENTLKDRSAAVSETAEPLGRRAPAAEGDADVAIKGDTTSKPINLALQGGGAHGAFAWGVLDYLLEDGRLDFEGISATSAGAVNAVVCAYGLHKGGREGARRALDNFWRAVADAGAAYRPMTAQWLAVCSGATPIDRVQLQSLFEIPRKAFTTYVQSLAELNPFVALFTREEDTQRQPPSRNLASLMFHTLSTMFSPYYFNPANYNPLKSLLEAHVDFAELRAARDGVKLHICAANVETGKIRIFKNAELTTETVLASSCLPQLFQSVEIDGEYYWDGGFIGNPAVFPLIYESQSRDVLIVHIDPIVRKGCPTSVFDIMNRVTEVSFNSSLMREMRAIAFVTRLIESGRVKDGGLKQMLMHAVRADEATSQLGALSKTSTDWSFLQTLFEAGRAAAAQWLDQGYQSIGKESTIDIEHDYL
jgi:NTE family protein